jgi:hypothetical protein
LDDPKTLFTDWIKYILNSIALNLKDFTDNDIKLDGEGVIVEIDEFKVAKRKFYRGHSVEGAWVIGGVDLWDRLLLLTQSEICNNWIDLKILFISYNY